MRGPCLWEEVQALLPPHLHTNTHNHNNGTEKDNLSLRSALQDIELKHRLLSVRHVWVKNKIVINIMIRNEILDHEKLVTCFFFASNNRKLIFKKSSVRKPHCIDRILIRTEKGKTNADICFPPVIDYIKKRNHLKDDLYPASSKSQAFFSLISTYLYIQKGYLCKRESKHHF